MTVREQIDRELEALPVDLQRKVLDYITHLNGVGFPPGTPGKKLIKLAGTLSNEDAEELKQIIEEGCEKIDYNEWESRSRKTIFGLLPLANNMI
jgi:hypothetical protein